MEEIRLHRIGIEKWSIIHSNFDQIYDLYKKKAENSGYFGDLKFSKEKGKVIIYSVIELPKIEINYISKSLDI